MLLWPKVEEGQDMIMRRQALLVTRCEERRLMNVFNLGLHSNFEST
jgi:hypothetical protein